MTPWWKPFGARRLDGLPEPGAVVAVEHRVWSVTRVDPLWPEDSDCPARLTHEVGLLGLTGRPETSSIATHPYAGWWVYPEGRFAMCSCCGEPPPCRAQLAADVARAEVAEMARFEIAGVCPACQLQVSGRQKSVTFEENLRVALGPPVSFHLGRRACRAAAEEYERRWVEADPERAVHARLAGVPRLR